MSRALFVKGAVVLGLAYLVLCGALFTFQRSFIYLPQPGFTNDPSSTTMLAVPGASVQVSTRPLRGAQALIYFGGNAEDVSLSLASLSRAFPAYAVYLMHYRGYGASTGSPTEDALHGDARALFDKVHAEHAAVTVIGRSLGSGVAVRLASERPVSRLVLVTPYASILEIAEGSMPWVPVRWLLRDTFESARYAPGISAPTLLIVAERDEVIPRGSTNRLLAAFKPGVATLRVLPGTGHNDLHLSPLYTAWLAGT